MNGLILALVLSQLPAPPQVPPVEPDFPAWSNEIAAKKKPTVVFVGMPGREVRGMLACQQPEFPDVKAPSIIVALQYTDGTMRRHAVLPGNATDLDIRHAAGLEVRPSARPFLPSQAPALDVDGRAKAASLRYNASHRCNVCGRTVTAVAGPGPNKGTHIHTCSCGNSWWH